MDTLGLGLNRDGDIPVGTQLVWQVQALITNGRLQPGELLPSVRRLADVAGVHVNTVRSVYERLEGEGFVVSRQGRGTFVADNVPQVDGRAVAARALAGAGAAPKRDELKDQISALEAQLSARVAAPSAAGGRAHPRVLTTEELARVRDELASRLEELDTMRDDLLGLLASIRTAMGEQPAPPKPSRAPKRTSPRPARAVQP